MSRKRHEMAKACKAGGGAIGGRKGEWVSGNPDVKKEAEGEEPYDKGDERKHGGKVKHKRKHGGKVHEMHAEGHKGKHRMDRPKRARGGSVRGSDRMPFSSAHKPSKGSEPSVDDNRGMKVSPEKDTRDE